MEAKNVFVLIPNFFTMNNANHVTARTLITAFALCGMLLSGYLSYYALQKTGCSQSAISQIVSCGGSKTVKLAGIPTCVYGFAMFLLVFVINMWSWSAPQQPGPKTAVLTLGIIGLLFSSGLLIYELFVLDIKFTTLPACAYGLAFYTGITICAVLFRRAPTA